MISWVLEDCVEYLQLDSGILCREPQPIFGFRPVSIALPSTQFLRQHCHPVDPAFKALTRKTAQSIPAYSANFRA
jgi:hypothetical protein